MEYDGKAVDQKLSDPTVPRRGKGGISGTGISMELTSFVWSLCPADGYLVFRTWSAEDL